MVISRKKLGRIMFFAAGVALILTVGYKKTTARGNFAVVKMFFRNGDHQLCAWYTPGPMAEIVTQRVYGFEIPFLKPSYKRLTDEELQLPTEMPPENLHWKQVDRPVGWDGPEFLEVAETTCSINGMVAMSSSQIKAFADKLNKDGK